MDVTTTKQLVDEVVAFRDEREWGVFHTRERLAQGISIEAAELLERFQWGKPSEAAGVCDELADVLIYALTMCREMGVTPESIVRRKIAMNAMKYPVDQWRGRAW